MTGRSKTLLWLAGLSLAAFGFFCLNYTKGFGIEHHVEWAAEHGMPAPSGLIFDAGVVLLALGGGLIGFALGRRGRLVAKA